MLMEDFVNYGNIKVSAFVSAVFFSMPRYGVGHDLEKNELKMETKHRTLNCLKSYIISCLSIVHVLIAHQIQYLRRIYFSICRPQMVDKMAVSSF